MKQIILLSLFVTLSFGLTAQVSFAPDSPFGEGQSNETALQVDITITNDLATTQPTFWYIDRITPTEGGELAPSDWEFQLCDINTCYFWGIEACPPNSPSEFTANQSSTWMLKMNPHGVAGVGNIILQITDIDGNIISSIPVGYDIEASSSTQDIAVKQIKIYPNPTSDFIQITNDNDVSKVAIYNIVGKNLNTSAHYAGKAHDVSTLQKGIYLVRLFDYKGEVLSVLRLNKN